jgi:hypothetical protein
MAEWLSPKLSPAGSQKILNCMRAPLSVGEEPGYIYVYKISGTTPSFDGADGRTFFEGGGVL